MTTSSRRLIGPAGAVVLLAASASPSAQIARPAVQIELGQMHPGGDLRFTGSPARRTIMFELNRRWRPARGSALHLIVQHSPNIDPTRSFLSVAINYGILRTIPLTRDNMLPTQLVVQIAPDLFRRENRLQFIVEQFADNAAGGTDVWTTVGGASFVQVEGTRGQALLDLAELPDAFTDASEASQIAVLRPQQPSTDTLEGTARLVATLAKSLLPLTPAFVVTASPDVAAPLVVVGTADEQPALARLSSLPLRVEKRGGARAVTRRVGGALAADDGLVGVAAGAREWRVLFATGNTPAAVHGAAAAVLRRKTLAGPIATVRPEREVPGAGLREWKGYVPPANSFTLADIAGGTLDVPLDSSTPLAIPLNVTPDARFLDFGHRINLRLSVNLSYFSPDATLRIGWNDVTLAEYRAGVIFITPVSSVPVRIPPEQIQRRNVLTLQWKHPALQDSGTAAVWLLSDSDFYLPRYYEAELPDLALLREGAYPFGLRPDLSDVALVIPDVLTDAGFSALLELASALGRLAPGPHLAFRVLRSSTVTEADRALLHLIALHSEESPNALMATLAERRRLLWRESPDRGAVVQEMISHWRSDRIVLMLSAASDRDLQRLVRVTFAEPVLNRLTGDAAHVTPSGVLSKPVALPLVVGRYSYLTASEAWLRTHWVALPAVLTVASGLFFVACRLALHLNPRSAGGRTAR